MKKKSKFLKILLKKSSLVILSSFIILSCAPKCDKEDLRILKEAENGNIEVIKKYLENGGDPLLNCSQFGGKGNFTSAISSDSDLYFSVCKSKSLPLIKYYLSKGIPNQIKNEMLRFFLGGNNEDILKILIKNNAKLLDETIRCNYMEGLLSEFRQLYNINYNFNWIGPKDGNNILMKYAKCPATENEEDLLNLIKYFVKIGVKTDIKNKEGKTAYDLATNQKIKEYLKSLN